jgi:hypothetical protein
MTSFQSALPLPADYPRIQQVSSFEELLTTRFQDGINALCWPRTLEGDFGEVATALKAAVGITTLNEAALRRLPLSPAGKLAVEAMLADQRRLREHGLDPVLDVINGYPPNDEPGPVRTDVCSFHVDSATAEADTWLCTYHGASSEGLRNDEAMARVDIPETRAELLRHYGGADDEGFAEYLNDHYFDLHYAPLPGARPFAFGQGHLWRIATEHPGCPVPPCIHRAPDPIPGQPRLLLIS